MSPEENKALVRRFQEEMWRGNIAIVDELVAPGTLLAGVDEDTWKAGVLETRASMPDLIFTIEEIIAEGDKVVVRWTTKGTHSNGVLTPFGLASPTGKMITVTGISIERVKDGKIVEDLYEYSEYSYYKQLGVISEPEQNS